MRPNTLNPTTRNPLKPQPTKRTHPRSRQSISHNRRLNTMDRHNRHEYLLLQPQVVRRASRPEFLQRLVDGGAGDDGSAQGVGDEVEEHEAADEAVLEGFGTGVGGYFAGGGEFGGGGHFEVVVVWF
ncbi:hypothetical protein O988_02458 [Pseudogymnoascus sp. VKM F-3808]|nr:hypothetical protein O988_02458 [Pseudogymnoascus sp. VKM F-3808]